MGREELIKLIEQKELELKKLSDEIYSLKLELQKENNSQMTKMSVQEKIKIYADYFKGRNDVYSYLSINKNDSSKKYYIPA